MELMRHSERKLTDKPRYWLTFPEKRVKTGQNLPKTAFSKRLEKRLEPAFLKEKLPKRAFETLVEVAGIEPASRNLSDSASTYVVLLLI